MIYITFSNNTIKCYSKKSFFLWKKCFYQKQNRIFIIRKTTKIIAYYIPNILGYKNVLFKKLENTFSKNTKKITIK